MRSEKEAMAPAPQGITADRMQEVAVVVVATETVAVSHTIVAKGPGKRDRLGKEPKTKVGDGDRLADGIVMVLLDTTTEVVEAGRFRRPLGRKDLRRDLRKGCSP